MKFCMVTTFYPPYHFGGDATHTYRLSNELARRGHKVDVIFDRDAYYLAHPGEPEQQYDQHPNIKLHALKSPFGPLSPLATQQTGRTWFKPRIKQLLDSGGYDVIHFHNSSLIGQMSQYSCIVNSLIPLPYAKAPGPMSELLWK